MTSLLLMMALACSPAVARDRSVKSANGRFALEMRIHPGRSVFDPPTTVSLVEPASGKVRWAREIPRWFGDEILVSNDGRWVAMLLQGRCENENDCNQLELWDAKGEDAAKVRVLEALSEEERQFLGHSMCGIHWLAKAAFEGERLLLEVVQGGHRPPIYDQGPTLGMTVELSTGKLTRAPAAPRPGTDQLVAAYRAAKDRRGRSSAFLALVAKAQLTQSAGDEALRGFFLERVRSSEDGREQSDAAEALGTVGTEAELDALAALPAVPAERDLGVLQALEKRRPALARVFALKCLKEQRQPELLRARAVVLLVRDDVPERWEAVRLGAADPSEQVRDSAGYGISKLAASEEGFSLLSELATGADAKLAARARGGLLLNYLGFRNPTPSWRARFVEAVNAGKLDRWGGALVVAGGVAEVRGSPREAERLYRRAAEVLDREKPGGRHWADRELWCEAKLRLAQMAAAAGRTAEAQKLAAEVKAAPDQSPYVHAPAPNVYAGAPGSVGRQPSVVADEVLKKQGRRR